MQIVVSLFALFIAAKALSRTQVDFAVRVGGPAPEPGEMRPGVAGDRAEPVPAERRST